MTAAILPFPDFFRVAMIVAAFVFLCAGGAYLNHQRDVVRCSIDDIRRGGSLETGTKHDIWFNRNTHGEVWLRNGETYCQIR